LLKEEETPRMTEYQPAALTLEGRVAIVTGGGNGMGERAAHTLAARGAAVIIIDRDPANGTRVADAIAADGGTVEYIHADVTVEDDIRQFVTAIEAKYGRIDVLDNNAAALELTATDGNVVDTSLETFTKTLAADVGGPFLVSKHVIPVMLKNGGGSIINMSSLSGLGGELTLTSYGVAKAGVMQLTRATATQYGHLGIRCNSIAPSYVSTANNNQYAPPQLEGIYERQTPSASVVDPQQVADVVAFLASDASRQINGHVIPVDGGFVAASSIVPDFRDQLGTGAQARDEPATGGAA
jgi:NAD(P)-dependent dehydrogenase (short-subunit alcohol dehydrogenase family)